jgi:ABC-2 type transport system ATP-binding protein
MAPIITTQNLSKTYRGGVQAVREVSLTMEQGEIFGLFGPNGAGKSTFVRMLTTLLAPTAGNAMVKGFDLQRQALQVRGVIGLVTADERSFYGRLTAAQNLSFFAAMQNVPRTQIPQRVADLLQLFGLEHKASAAAQSLSSGQKQRLNIARALLHDPPILFLDEPTKSMDVQTSDFVKGLVRKQLVDREGKTVLFISHELFEMDNFCDRVAILADGRVRVVGSPEELGALLPRRALYRLVVNGPPSAVQVAIDALPGVDAVTLVSQGVSSNAYDVALADESAWLAVMGAVGDAGGRVETYRRVDDESLRRIVAYFSENDGGQ